MSSLAVILANLYPDREGVEILLHSIDVDPHAITLEGSSIARWEQVLEELWKHHKLEDVVNVASSTYKARGVEMSAALKSYLEMRKTFLSSLSSGNMRRFLTRRVPLLHRLDWFLTNLGLLPKPIESNEIRKYLSRLYAKIEQNMRQNQREYIPLNAEIIPKIREGLDPNPEENAFVNPIPGTVLHITGRAQGGDSVSARISVVNRKTRRVHNIFRHIDTTKVPLILLGEPGGGKTMTLQQAAMMLAGKELHYVFPLVPIYVRLGEFHVDAGREVGMKDVEDYVKRWLASEPAIRDRFDALLEEGRLVIFFDGMDEMSRERYSDHTKALSEFAGHLKGMGSKTLFSCRITDFSPQFTHERLVLLPFDRHQVRDYLSRYIGPFPIVIADDARQKEWTLKELTKYMLRGDLPIEADNPFVLWLLSWYLQGKKHWPTSRIDLLDYHCEYNYKRKSAENSDSTRTLPEMEDAFREWGRFAYLITERNQGSVIATTELEAGHDKEVVQAMIRAGKTCGILAESHDTQVSKVRFEHHRFQEYFTAHHINGTHKRLRWLDKLDAPRWQETMINLILMGGAGSAMSSKVTQALANSISVLLEACKAEFAAIERRKEEYKRRVLERLQARMSSESENHEPESTDNEAKKLEIALSDKNETVLADRVELTSRILHQCASVGLVRDALMPPFQEAVSFLATYGNPITQVKMMEACQNVKEIDFIEALKKPLNSPINWVRDQALILISANRGGARATRTNLATEIGYDLANGSFPHRFSAYWKAISSSESNSHRLPLAISSICYLVQFIILIFLAGSIYYGAWSLRSVQIENLPVVNETSANQVLNWVGQPLKWVVRDYLKFFSDLFGVDINRWFSPHPASSPASNTATIPSFQNFDLAILGEPWSVAIFIVVLMLIIGVTLKSAPSSVSLTLTGGGLLVPLCILLVNALWKGNGAALGGLFLLTLFGSIPVVVLLGLIAIIVQVSVLVIYLVATTTVRGRSHNLMSFIRVTWKSPAGDAVREYWSWIPGGLLSLLAIYLGFLLAFFSSALQPFCWLWSANGLLICCIYPTTRLSVALLYLL
ncbi:MAG TPA: NACHT domain-containing protein [Chloroflexia bacterium]|jgi:SpoVK/Ycf46/Vps4 family AAA+-type ATPase